MHATGVALKDAQENPAGQVEHVVYPDGEYYSAKALLQAIGALVVVGHFDPAGQIVQNP